MATQEEHGKASGFNAFWAVYLLMLAGVLMLVFPAVKEASGTFWDLYPLVMFAAIGVAVYRKKTASTAPQGEDRTRDRG
jgi:hypothetical protein